jgi:poly-beta-1,6-N-acetyl-D-glucosamine synthase
MAIVFWISFAVVFYTYLGYPLWLWLLKKVRPRPVAKGEVEPQVSVVLAACNEERNIVGRIENLLGQEYPPEKLEIIVVSDGSEDATVALARGGGAGNIVVLALPERQGKAVALNLGVVAATGEVVLFCDARQSFAPDVVRQLVANFADPAVGAASGELMLYSRRSGQLQAELGAYWRYEKWIRKAESACGSVVGATGAVYAIRRRLYRPLPPGTLLDDVLTPMQIVMQGYRVVFDGEAKAYDIVSQNVSQEWVRKVRTLAGNWQLLGNLPALLLPWRNPCCWRYLSHKVLRLLVPLALVSLLVSGAVADGLVYRAATWLQGVFYAMAALGGAIPAARTNKVIKLSCFFAVMNLVAVAGFWRWATGRSATAWRPAYAKEGSP